jgi:predicted GIY-YIG superfamily endonuclease
MSKTNIYILKLKEDKYYVGKSDNPLLRFEEHQKGNGSAWTKKYTPISIEKIIPNVSHFDEDKYTKEYMAKYGIDNVRGGSYVNIYLDDFQTETLNREIWAAQNKCTRCGRGGHFVKDCFAKVDINDYIIDADDDDSSDCVWVCEKCNKEFEEEDECERHVKYCKVSKKNNYKTSNDKCYRCGREGHYASDCYAQRHIEGYYLY